MSTEQETLEINIKEAKEAISKSEALERLQSNKDFIEVITEGYFKEEASTLVLRKAVPAMVDKESQEAIIKAIDSIGYLRQYLLVVNHYGSMAKKALADDEQTREELLAEEV